MQETYTPKNTTDSVKLAEEDGDRATSIGEETDATSIYDIRSSPPQQQRQQQQQQDLSKTISRSSKRSNALERVTSCLTTRSIVDPGLVSFV
jgi:hypothetical protein